jgi:shikimate dehydrogenase
MPALVAWEALPSDAAALEVIYAPPETPFLRRARERGLRSANGFGMLARQGALALELWLGREAPLDAMRAALEAPA